MSKIRDSVFNDEWAVLKERFGRFRSNPAVETEVMARYKVFLDRKLTTEEFRLALVPVFFSDDVFPSPQRIVEAFEEARGAEVERQVLAILTAADKHGQDGFYNLPRDLQEKLDSAVLWKRAVLSKDRKSTRL